ncbi:MAG: DUF2974 domain-containing protein [Clostridiales bacterium]|jgi:pimeloyl-ACP methyl ester carboxylesterase|nr:DUF2974 domain-containing protein [Clostridiales bacterium]
MIALTDRDVITLVKYAYMDLSSETDYDGYNAQARELCDAKTTIGDTDKYFISQGKTVRRPMGRVRFNFPKVISDIRLNTHINSLRLIAHRNDNVKPGHLDGDGVVMYALLSQGGSDVLFLARGSEGGMFTFADDWAKKIVQGDWTDALRSEDWRDNFAMAFGTSRAFAPASEFAEDVMSRYPGRTYTAYGHSKGGGVAMYLAARYGFGGAGVDGVGLPVETFLESPDRKDRLERSGFVNKSAENDIVSELLIHYERRERLKMNRRFPDENGVMISPFGAAGFANAHYPDAIALNVAGMGEPAPGESAMPKIVSVINKALMLTITYEKMPRENKDEAHAVVDGFVDKTIGVVEKLARV